MSYNKFCRMAGSSGGIRSAGFYLASSRRRPCLSFVLKDNTSDYQSKLYGDESRCSH